MELENFPENCLQPVVKLSDPAKSYVMALLKKSSFQLIDYRKTNTIVITLAKHMGRTGYKIGTLFIQKVQTLDCKLGVTY